MLNSCLQPISSHSHQINTYFLCSFQKIHKSAKYDLTHTFCATYPFFSFVLLMHQLGHSKFTIFWSFVFWLFMKIWRRVQKQLINRKTRSLYNLYNTFYFNVTLEVLSQIKYWEEQNYKDNKITKIKEQKKKITK